MPANSELSERIRVNLRRELQGRNMTHHELAEGTGTREAAISRILSTTKPEGVTLDRLDRIAQFLEVHPARLVRKVENRRRKVQAR